MHIAKVYNLSSDPAEQTAIRFIPCCKELEAEFRESVINKEFSRYIDFNFCPFCNAEYKRYSIYEIRKEVRVDPDSPQTDQE